MLMRNCASYSRGSCPRDSKLKRFQKRDDNNETTYSGDAAASAATTIYISQRSRRKFTQRSVPSRRQKLRAARERPRRYHVTTYQRNICLLTERSARPSLSPSHAFHAEPIGARNRRPSAIVSSNTTAVMRELMRFNC